MKYMFILVGLPASGKSTLAGSISREKSLFVYSTDRYITEEADARNTTYDAIFAETISAATKYMNSHLDCAIAADRNVVWDQTNLGVKKRAKIINRAKQAGYQIVCHYIVPPSTEKGKNVLTERLASRPGKTIPKHVIDSMAESYVVPTIDEGFDSLWEYDMYGNVIELYTQPKKET